MFTVLPPLYGNHEEWWKVAGVFALISIVSEHQAAVRSEFIEKCLLTARRETTGRQSS